MIIYKTTNLINGKIYIGYDTKEDSNYLGSGSIFRKAIKKYGKENFRKSIIDSSDSFEELCLKEIFWIDFYNARDSEIGYNVSEGGFAGFKGCKFSGDALNRISLAKLGNKNFLGHIHSEKTKAKIRLSKIGVSNNAGANNYMYGKHHSDIAKKKIQAKALDGKNKGQNNPMSKTNREKRQLLEAA